MPNSNRPKTAWTMLFRVVDRLRAKSARNVTIPNMKITLGKIRIINYLFVREGEPPMLKEIAETFGLTSGAVSQTVDALTADGVVPVSDGKRYEKYTIHHLSGAVSDQKLIFQCRMGDKPFSFSGKRKDESPKY